MSATSGLPDPPPPDSFVPPSGEALAAMLPHYEILRLIAAGGMGAVYEGRQRALDRPVAIKILPPDAARDSDSIERFRAEGRAMGRLSHPNIPAVYDFDVSSGYCYLAMEYVDGWNAHELISRGELTPELTCKLLIQACDALQFAHEQGIVHGDIKPSNLLVSQDGRLKLTDFGLARLVDKGPRNPDNFEPMATPEYAAPELWQQGVVPDHRADLYSVGCVFYEMLTGTVPAGEFVLPAAGLGLSPAVDAIIVRAMHRDPAQRYQSAGAIARDLEAVLHPPHHAAKAPTVRILRPHGVRSRAGAGPPAVRKKQDSSRGPLISLMVLTVVGIASWLLLKDRLSPPPDPSPGISAIPPPPAPGPAVQPAVTPPDSAPAESPDSSPADSSPSAPPEPDPAPPPQPVAVPPDPAPQPVSPGLSPATRDTLTAFLTKYGAEWRITVSTKREAERDRISAYYRTALEKLRADSAAGGEEDLAAAARAEIIRTKNAVEAVPEEAISRLDKLAALQKTLNTALSRAHEKFSPAARQVREKALLELRKIQTTVPSTDQPDLNSLYDKIVNTPDLSPVLKP